MKTSGDRATWVNRVAQYIMDSGATPPSMDKLYANVPYGMVTAINDGHVTAGEVLGEKHRDDFRAGQRIIIDEMVEKLREQGFIGGEPTALRWLKPLNGEWKIRLDKSSITIWGQKERRISRDSHILGDRPEDDRPVDGWRGLVATGGAEGFTVDVLGARDSKRREKYEVHPYALLVPPMTVVEREAFRQDIAENGVKVPLVLYPDAKDLNQAGNPRLKVLDGRHRLYFASQLKKPVRVEIFDGDDAAARKLVVSLNFKRRHLTALQQLDTAILLYGEEAHKEAKQAQLKGAILGNKSRSPVPEDSPEPAADTSGGDTRDRIVKKAQDAGLTAVTQHGVKNFGVVLQAPKTLAKVRSGEITTLPTAKREAEKEIAQIEGRAPKPPLLGGDGLQAESIATHLGRACGHLKTILQNQTLPHGKDIVGAYAELEYLVPKVGAMLRARGLIAEHLLSTVAETSGP